MKIITLNYATWNYHIKCFVIVKKRELPWDSLQRDSMGQEWEQGGAGHFPKSTEGSLTADALFYLLLLPMVDLSFDMELRITASIYSL